MDLPEAHVVRYRYSRSGDRVTRPPSPQIHWQVWGQVGELQTSARYLHYATVNVEVCLVKEDIDPMNGFESPKKCDKSQLSNRQL